MPTIVLSVAEKPSVAREIAAALAQGGRPERPTSRGGNPIWIFPGHMPGIGQVEMHVTSVSGHLMEHDFEGRYR